MWSCDNKDSERDALIADLKADPEYRFAYAEDFLNTSIATQIRVLREQRKMTQVDLALDIGSKQAGVSRLENVNYSAWKTETLRKLARAFDVRLRISFETFGTLLDDDARFSRESLQRPKFEDDPTFGTVADPSEPPRERPEVEDTVVTMRVISSTTIGVIQQTLPLGRPQSVPRSEGTDDGIVQSETSESIGSITREEGDKWQKTAIRK